MLLLLNLPVLRVEHGGSERREVGTGNGELRWHAVLRRASR